MSIPGIALFYGGLVRQKNVLSIIMQTIFLVAVVSILWVIFGYSWVFDTSFAEKGNPLAFVTGGFGKAFMNGISPDSVTSGNIPELLFAMFQCMFAVITPALILGAFAERIKFSGYIVFIVLWVTLAYFPMAHWVWGGGFLQKMGAIDFAGGTVVHINAGIAANAFMVTHTATAAAALTWMAIDWIFNKKPTVIGTCTGAVAGTPLISLKEVITLPAPASTAALYGGRYS